jgi:dUTP pyrophosphatase|tara:strand:- start:1338 stop:1847 length:510 start_codon:yes stop_codon:yes gene_type:complete
MNTLRIKVLDESLEPLYKKRVNVEGDAGVDLYFPEEVVVPGKTLGMKIDLKIQAEMCQAVNKQLTQNIPPEMLQGMNIEDRYLSYKVVPRSSIIKTPLRMANSVGIMDAGYRGNYMVPVDNLSDEDFIIEKHTRLFQVVGANLDSINVELVNTLSNSKRGDGGFGSTGN